MVLEWLEGSTLDELLEREAQRGKRRPGASARCTRCSRQVARRARRGARQGHRPPRHQAREPVRARGDARSGQVGVKVLDFGVAKMMSDNTQLKAALAKTGMGVTSFTPQYGAPEQFTRSYGATGPWTDVYALALVARRDAHRAPGARRRRHRAARLRLRQSRAAPDAARARCRACPDAVEAVFQKALAVSPKDRFARAARILGGVRSRSRRCDGVPTLADAAEHLVPLATRSADRADRARPGDGSRARASARPAARPQRPGRGPREARSKAGLVVGRGRRARRDAAGAAFFLEGLGRRRTKRPRAATAGEAALRSRRAAPPSRERPARRAECPEGMAKIAAGQFFQGSDAKDAQANEKPAHNVTLDAYCIDLREVTAGEYEACSSVGKVQARRGNEVDWPKITRRRQEALLAALHLRSKRQGRPPDQLRELGDGAHLLQGAGQAPAHRSRVGIRDARSRRSRLPVGRRRADRQSI